MRQLKLIAGFVLCLGVLPGFRPLTACEPAAAPFYHPDTASDGKLAAFKILEAKCNVCHTGRNPGKVFTMANMNALAQKINEQVFIQKRMPRGNKIRLTADEYHTLGTWLLTENSSN